MAEKEQKLKTFKLDPIVMTFFSIIYKIIIVMRNINVFQGFDKYYLPYDNLS